jgi:dynein heavy chain
MLNTIKLYQGQILITMAQLSWTTDVKYALEMLDSPAGSPAALKKCRQTYKKKVENYIELVEKPGISKVDRLKLVALIIIDEHNREIIERIYSQKITSPRNFEWLQ